ncbi:MAG: hypothetical protein JXJ22_00220 [Bacteroidales bacterium]|nr:hypothetical protein [Bacteroidales bacterium]
MNNLVLHNEYLKQAESLKISGIVEPGKISWKCPSNIALIKYWGKLPGQLPRNPSLSFSLNNSTTTLNLEYKSINERDKESRLDFTFEGMKNPEFSERINLYLHRVAVYFPFLNQLKIEIQSSNSFPHSAGIASSASSLGALALAVCSIEQRLFGTLSEGKTFFRKASFMARLGSGSASRSVFPGYTVWGKTELVESSSDETAVPINAIIHPVFSDYRDDILIISSGKKNISSSEGHSLMENHIYAPSRYQQAGNNFAELLRALHLGDESAFGNIAENEALSLHALMMTSEKSFVLMQANTLEAIHRIREFRIRTGLHVYFTLDAGANIHLLYAKSSSSKVHDFIKNQLAELCENRKWISDFVGNGPVKLI